MGEKYKWDVFRAGRSTATADLLSVLLGNTAESRGLKQPTQK